MLLNGIFCIGNSKFIIFIPMNEKSEEQTSTSENELTCPEAYFYSLEH